MEFVLHYSDLQSASAPFEMGQAKAVKTYHFARAKWNEQLVSDQC